MTILAKSLPVLIPILARTEPEVCGQCGALIYWTVASVSGVVVAVEIQGPDTVAPTRQFNGFGTTHVCPPSLDRLNDKRREYAPL